MLVLISLLSVGCAPSIANKAISEKSIPPFHLGENWFLYAGGSNVGNGDNLMLSVLVPPLENRESNFYYTIGSAESKSSYLYYYPDQDAIAVYVFLKPTPTSELESREALVCFAYNSGSAWTGFWIVSRMEKIQEAVEKEPMVPQGSCSLNRQ